jgi:hypothetical protein
MLQYQHNNISWIDLLINIGIHVLLFNKKLTCKFNMIFFNVFKILIYIKKLCQTISN